MTEVAPATTFILFPAIAWAEGRSAVEREGDFEAAWLFESGFRRSCRIERISASGATLRGQLAAAAGASVMVELATGQRSSGKVAWASDSSTGVAFDQPIDILPLITRKLVSQPAESRKMPRVELRCTGRLKNDGEFYEMTVRNIAAGGLQLEGNSFPHVGAEVVAYLEGLNVPPGKLIWKRNTLAAVQLRNELSWSSSMLWLRQLAVTQQAALASACPSEA
jgi:hypothetical protein